MIENLNLQAQEEKLNNPYLDDGFVFNSDFLNGLDVQSAKKRIIQEIEKKGVEVVYITLDIGLGTFEPIRIDNFEHHVMHSETILFHYG